MSAISDGEPVSSDEYRLTSDLKHKQETHMAAPSTSSLNEGIVPPTWTDQHLSELQSSYQTSQIDLASPQRASFSQMQSSNEASGQTTAGHLDNLNVDNLTKFSGLEVTHECQTAQEGASATQDPLSLKDNSTEQDSTPRQR